ncbi:endoplasmic reticulum-Golgi intermediate compartment protein 1 isoform X1 [Papio anubis]|uniref:endoplasmic reticulum-Golgi intermediate compartment protein 1 isoform X1 n=1 Tax=Papio anubis TaxID=9555 RepID=UPI0004F20A39|nr:endoplasmic reticulum-Golgi intermediate compartment protein 1 isoform X1 [Papio anubis]
MLCPSKNTFPFIASAHRMLLYPGVGPGGRVLFPVSWKHLGGSCSPAGPALPVALTSGKPDSRPSPGCLSSSCASLSSSVCCRWGRFDIYRKVPKDLTQPTYTGAIISICCCLFILFLFLSELTGFITTEVVNELYVDDPDKDSGGKIDVSLNISLPNLHCELVGLDIQDEMGRHEVGHIDNSMKIPLNNGAGCRFEGQFSINKVPGNFHVSTHSATAQPQNPDMTHVIHKLSFGDTLQVQNVHGAFNALGGADRLTSNPLASHDYILKIVPTVYEDKSGKQRYSYQYTVANKEYVAYSHTGRIIPAIWFRYDLSPITVKYTERRQPLYRFITTICAIIGGTFTVAGILDSCIFTASEAWKKIQLGKMH